MDPHRIWGKSRGLPRPYPLVAHLLDAAAAVAALWSEYLAPVVQRRLQLGDDEETGLRWVMLLAGLHDIGKCCAGFQGLDPVAWETLNPGRPLPRAIERGHTRPGQASIQLDGLIPVEGSVAASEDLTSLIGQVIGGHHGVLPAPLTTRFAEEELRATGGFGPLWTDARRVIADLVLHAVGRLETPDGLSTNHLRRFALAACGVVPLADWVVSQEHVIQRRFAGVPAEWTPGSAREFLERGVEQVTAELERIGLRRLRRRSLGFAQRFGFPPRGVQQSLVDQLAGPVTGPALLVVMAPTGQGKTEAAVHAAEIMGAAAGSEGLFVGLPTMATADSMFCRVVEDLDRTLDNDAAANLLHSMAAYTPELRELIERATRRATEQVDAAEVDRLVTEEGEKTPVGRAVASDWMRGGKRGLLAPVCVGTVDQLLAVGLRSTHQPLRSLALTGKVVVVDEAHAYDSFMQTLLRRVVAWLGAFGAPVVLLSATLPVPVARSLVEAYAAGAERWRRQNGVSVPGQPDGGSLPQISYPGWVVHDAGTGRTTAVSCPVPDDEAVPLRFRLQPYLAGEEEFAARCRQLLRPVLTGDGPGCALVDKERKQVAAELLGVPKQVTGAGLALFGRMIASLPEGRIDGAVQVAHAFTTHQALTEVDYFTAVDDVTTGVEDSGSGYLGTAEYAAGVLNCSLECRRLWACVSQCLCCSGLSVRPARVAWR